jgi:hypothetical protein
MFMALSLITSPPVWALSADKLADPDKINTTQKSDSLTLRAMLFIANLLQSIWK